MTVRRYETSSDADRHDLEFWMHMSDAERVLQVWRLSEEVWRLRGDPPHEPGLHRSVVRIIRNRPAGVAPKDLSDIEGME